MTIDLTAIKTGLFQSSKLRDRILRDYCVSLVPKDCDEFAHAVISRFDQAPHPAPLDQTLSNGAVFRAAVLALASNQRPWATFLKFKQRLEDLLIGYDPVQTLVACGERRLTVNQLKKCLPGTTSTADANAIVTWASILRSRIGTTG